MSPRAQDLIEQAGRDLAGFRRDIEARARADFGGSEKTWPAFLRLKLAAQGYLGSLTQWARTVRCAEARWRGDEEMLRKAQEGRARNMRSATVAFPTVDERNTYMLQRRREGASLRQIAREVGLSVTRARGCIGRAEDAETADARAQARARKRRIIEQRLSELPQEAVRELERRITIKVPPAPMRHVWTPERQWAEMEAERG